MTDKPRKPAIKSASLKSKRQGASDKKPDEWAENMQAAAVKFGVPKPVQIAAKASGSDAFRQQQVNGPKLLSWVKANPDLVKAATEAIHDKSSESELKREIKQVQLALLKAKLVREGGDVIPKATARDEWARTLAILQEEFRQLMPADQYRVAVTRAQTRIGQMDFEDARK